MVSGTIFGHIFFWKDPVSNLKASLKISLRISSEAGGGGTRPQGVFNIRRPRVAVSRVCLNRVSNPYPNPFKSFLKESQGVLAPVARGTGSHRIERLSKTFST